MPMDCNIMNIHFAYCWVLFLLILIPILAFVYYRFLYPKYYTHFKISNLHTVEGHSLRGLAKMYLLPLLRYLSIAFLIIALARPQKIDTEQEIKGEGIDIMLVMDLSSSMLAKDFKPDRLEASKKVAADFVDKRDFDRIGLVAFSGEAYTSCPLTTDYRILHDFLSHIQCGILEDGTAIGMGLATAVNRIKENESESKVIVLLTDGMNNAGYYDPIDAANMAKTLGIKIYTIGVGTMGEALAPIRRNFNGEYQFGLVPVEIDEQLLVKMSDMTGGKYYRATNNERLQEIYDEIDKLEKTEFQITYIDIKTEIFHQFLKWAFILLMFEMILKYTVLKSLP